MFYSYSIRNVIFEQRFLFGTSVLYMVVQDTHARESSLSLSCWKSIIWEDEMEKPRVVVGSTP